MNFAAWARRLLPQSLANLIRRVREQSSLKRLNGIEWPEKHLKPIDGAAVKVALDDGSAEAAWNEFSRKLDSLNIVTHAGGVNPGDRRAIFHLIYSLRPDKVLEIGTHIGASTVCIAGALKALQNSDPGFTGSLITVDVGNVNDEVEKPWLRYGARSSPAELLAEMNVRELVEFIQSDSLEYLAKGDEFFDFIFLDGDHQAKTVYREIPLVIKSLNQDGHILLHDYYPGGRALWRDGRVLPGPYLALKRHIEEGRSIDVRPLGVLPWPTKGDSTTTSLAMLSGTK